jgi:ketosteroid isomerase-like protein
MFTKYFFKSFFTRPKITVMTKLFNQLIILTAVIFLAACNTASTDAKTDETTGAKETTSFDLAAAKSSIESMNAKFSESFRKKDSAAIASYYSDDARMLPPNSEPVSGPGIVSLWGAFIGMGFIDLKLMTDDVSGNQDQLAETGHYELVGAGNKVMDKGKYVVVWKPVNGGWKLYRDIWNSSMPAAPSK